MTSVQENATGVIQTAHFQREVLLRRCPFVSWLVNHRVQWWPGLPRLFICRAGGSDWGHTAEPDTGKGADDNLTATSTLRVLGRRRKNGPGHRRPHPTPSGRPSFRGTLFCGRQLSRINAWMLRAHERGRRAEGEQAHRGRRG